LPFKGISTVAEMENTTKSRVEEFHLRILVAVLLIPTVLVLSLHPSLRFIWTLICVCLGVLGIREFFEMVKAQGVTPNYLTGILGTVSLCLVAHFRNPTYVMFTFAAVMNCGGIAQLVYRGPKAIMTLGGTVYGLAYIPFLGSYVILLRGVEPGGAGLLLLFFGITWMNDIGAYLVGSAIGRHKIVPYISPKKTYEGAIGGLLFGIGTAMILGELSRAGWVSSSLQGFGDGLLLVHWTRLQIFAAALVVGVLCQFGDMFESYIKRSANMKDSGNLIPGHGGVLDRIDGILFAAPALYYFARLVVE